LAMKTPNKVIEGRHTMKNTLAESLSTARLL
jgi:hypothetical protein